MISVVVAVVLDVDVAAFELAGVVVDVEHLVLLPSAMVDDEVDDGDAKEGDGNVVAVAAVAVVGLLLEMLLTLG